MVSFLKHSAFFRHLYFSVLISCAHCRSCFKAVIHLHLIFEGSCHVSGRRSAMGFRLLLYSTMMLQQLMVMRASSLTCQSFLKAPDCAVGTFNGEQVECSWCIRESDSSQRDKEGNIKEVGKCVSAGERPV